MIHSMKTRLLELIKVAFPQSTSDVTDETPKGFWINIDNAGKKVAVEYHEDKGFGISDMSQEVGYGEDHDMFTEDIEDVTRLIGEIFQKTKPA